MRKKIEEYAEQTGSEIIFFDGFDEAIIGICKRYGQNPIVAYDYEKCIDILLVGDEMSREEAEEYFEFNVSGAYVGASTPCFLNKLEC